MKPFLKVCTVLCIFQGPSVAFIATQVNADVCNSSKWGPSDEIGAANLITPASVLKAVGLIKTGKTYSLGITLDSSTPAYPPRSMSLQVVQPNQQAGVIPFPNGVTYNDDMWQGWFGIGSQIDGFGHLGVNNVYYNCNEAKDFAGIDGLKKLSVDKIPPIVSRGIVLDMAGHFGVEYMEAGATWSVQDIEAVANKQGTPVMEGDVVLFHTGWTDALLKSNPEKWVSSEPGQSEEAAEYLASKNVIAVGADTWGLDPIPPAKPGRPWQGHVIFLKENGIYILEVMNTGQLVRDKAFEFLFVLGQAKIKGTVQMIINPVAIV